MLTIEQAREYLTSVGVNLPEWLLLALLEQVNSVAACLEANGATPGQITLALCYLLGMIGLVQGDRYVTSQRAPSGAAQSFKFQSLGDAGAACTPCCGRLINGAAAMHWCHQTRITKRLQQAGSILGVANEQYCALELQIHRHG